MGYRMMWVRLRRHGILATRDQVAACMTLLGLGKDAPGQRKKHHPNYFSQLGPNYTWHIDGNDKLSHWGFYVHGAIDGFSRKILWLKVFSTNKDPWLIAKYFLETVEKCQGCPTRVRMDPGTENPLVSKCQMFLRRHGQDSLAGPKSYYQGSSTTNEPIEAFWRYFRENAFQFWIDQFKNLEVHGKWNSGNSLHQMCLLYVYVPILQQEIEEVTSDWNTHRIRLQRGKLRPCGVPNDLFEFPSLNDAQEMKKEVEGSDITFLKNKFNFIQGLEYLPRSFIEEADEFINDTEFVIRNENASEIYDALVEHFSQ